MEIKEANPKRIFVGNLRSKLDADALNATFGAVGKVTAVELSQNQNFAFVEFASVADADKAVEQLNEKEVNGQALRVRKEESRAPPRYVVLWLGRL